MKQKVVGLFLGMLVAMPIQAGGMPPNPSADMMRAMQVALYVSPLDSDYTGKECQDILDRWARQEPLTIHDLGIGYECHKDSRNAYHRSAAGAMRVQWAQKRNEFRRRVYDALQEVGSYPAVRSARMYFLRSDLRQTQPWYRQAVLDRLSAIQ